MIRHSNTHLHYKTPPPLSAQLTTVSSGRLPRRVQHQTADLCCAIAHLLSEGIPLILEALDEDGGGSSAGLHAEAVLLQQLLLEGQVVCAQLVDGRPVGSTPTIWHARTHRGGGSEALLGGNGGEGEGENTERGLQSGAVRKLQMCQCRKTKRVDVLQCCFRRCPCI